MTRKAKRQQLPVPAWYLHSRPNSAGIVFLAVFCLWCGKWYTVRQPVSDLQQQRLCGCDRNLTLDICGNLRDHPPLEQRYNNEYRSGRNRKDTMELLIPAWQPSQAQIDEWSMVALGEETPAGRRKATEVLVLAKQICSKSA